MREIYSLRIRRLHEELYNRLVHSRYNRQMTTNEKYRKGKVDALHWLCSLLEHHMEKERALDRNLYQEVKLEDRKIRALPPSSYREGIEEIFREFYRLYEGRK
jgi:cyanate lyase